MLRIYKTYVLIKVFSCGIVTNTDLRPVRTSIIYRRLTLHVSSACDCAGTNREWVSTYYDELNNYNSYDNNNSVLGKKKITRIAVGSGAVVASGCSDDGNGGSGDGVLRPRI